MVCADFVSVNAEQFTTIPTLLKSFGFWLVCLVTRRRRPVDMTFEDLTERVRAWAVLPRVEFNRKMEEWYNA